MFQQKSNKKIGRFIGKANPLRDVVVITDFTLKDIAQTVAIMPDNLTGAIFHRALHNASAEEMGILETNAILKDFNPDGGRPILEPMDFTEDWKRQRQRMSSRRGRGEDDEDFDLYGEEGQPLVSSSTSEEENATQPGEAKPEEVVEEKRSENFFKIQRESVDEAARALHDAQSPEAAMEDAVVAAIKAPVNTPPAPAPEGKAFVPMRVNLTQEAAASPEMEAVRSYQTQLIDREKIVEEAKAVGYQEGFKLGEEKAALQARRQIQELAATLAPLVAELDGLKKNILINAQDNFQTLCQAMMEAVLRREFDMNPGAFASIIERAIEETVPDDSFRIHVHPELLESASRHFPERIRSRLSPDKNLAKGDFRVESQLTVVDGNVTQMIRDLLDQADLSLYQVKSKEVKGKAS